MLTTHIVQARALIEAPTGGTIRIRGRDYVWEPAKDSKGQSQYKVKGTRGAAYMTMRNVHDTSRMFLVSLRDFGTPEGMKGVWLSDTDGTLQVLKESEARGAFKLYLPLVSKYERNALYAFVARLNTKLAQFRKASPGSTSKYDATQVTDVDFSPSSATLWFALSPAAKADAAHQKVLALVVADAILTHKDADTLFRWDENGARPAKNLYAQDALELDIVESVTEADATSDPAPLKTGKIELRGLKYTWELLPPMQPGGKALYFLKGARDATYVLMPLSKTRPDVYVVMAQNGRTPRPLSGIELTLKDGVPEVLAP